MRMATRLPSGSSMSGKLTSVENCESERSRLVTSMGRKEGLMNEMNEVRSI